MLSEKYNDIDNLSSISDITEQTISSDSSEECIQKKIEISKIFDTELNKLNVDSLKDKCKEFNIPILSKMKKLDLFNILNVEFEKFWSIIYNKKIFDLKNICKTLDIKSINGLKKDALCVQILTHCASKIILNPDSLKKYSKKIRTIAYLSPAEVISEYGIGGDEAIENAWVEYHQESYTKQLETERREEELLKEQKRLDRKNKKLLTPSVTRPVLEAPTTETPEINTESSPEAETLIDRTDEEITKNFYVTQLSSGIQATIRGRGRDYDECRSDLVRRLMQRYPGSTEADYTIEDAPDDAQAQ